MTNLRLYKLNFDKAHFGSDGLDSSTIACGADTLFSALCIEALKVGKDECLTQLVNAVRHGSLRLTDLNPYVGSLLLIPKPIASIKRKKVEADSVIKKQVKKVSYIPINKVNKFLEGDVDLGELVELQKQIGQHSSVTRVAVPRHHDEDTEPYRVVYFQFESNSGLWLTVSGSNTELELVDKLLRALTSLGGERTSGYGYFSLNEIDTIPTDIVNHISTDVTKCALTLTTSLPSDNELPSVVDGASYTLIRRSGFVSSATYAKTPRRKRDVYKLAAGSVVYTAFAGQIVDVSREGSHPVWSYAKPLFFEVTSEGFV